MVLILTLAVRSADMEEMALANQEAHGSCVVAAHMAKLEQAQSLAKHVLAEAAGRFKKLVTNRCIARRYCKQMVSQIPTLASAISDAPALPQQPGKGKEL